jgi:hypothetical protein
MVGSRTGSRWRRTARCPSRIATISSRSSESIDHFSNSNRIYSILFLKDDTHQPHNAISSSHQKAVHTQWNVFFVVIIVINIMYLFSYSAYLPAEWLFSVAFV